jgi:hypothetical protein
MAQFGTPPAIRAQLKRDFVTGKFATIKAAAISLGVKHSTAWAWAKAEKWQILRNEWTSRHSISLESDDLPTALPKSPLPALDASANHLGALCATVTDGEQAERLARALQTIELTRFAVTNGYWPGNPKPAPDSPKPNTPKRLKPSEREPLARLIPPSPPEPDASPPSDS